MRVLFILETYPPVIRASGKIIRDLAMEFKEHNHEVYVLTLMEEEYRKNAQVEIYDEDGIKIISVIVKKYKGINYIRRGILEAKCGDVTAENLINLRDEIINLYKNEELRIQLGKNGRKFLEENLTVEKAYEEIIRIYNEKRSKK